MATEVMSKRRAYNQSNTIPNPNRKVPLKLLSISNEINTAIKRCIKNSGLENSVAFVEVPPSTLSQQLLRNRLYDRLCKTEDCITCPNGRDGVCMSFGAIYLIFRKTFGNGHNGEMDRLHKQMYPHKRCLD